MNTILLLTVLVVLACSFAYGQNTDEITKLPGLPEPVKFKQYAGYMVANTTNGRNLFYWFVESQSNPSTDPVVLWLNGGPGCSSLAGLSTEHGPYLVNADGKTLRMNPYSWNQVANVIYLESPAGVGYSYSNTPTDYSKYNDDITADDSYHFLLNFFAKYPQFQQNKFYVSGESFAGHYVPRLAQRIHDGNARREGTLINLNGIFVGNGCTDQGTDANSIPPYMAQHSLIPMSQYDQGVKACQGDFYKNQNVPACASFLTAIWNNLNNINPYYLYDSCPVTPIAKVMARKYTGDDKIHPLFTMFRRRFSRAGLSGAEQGRVGVEYDSPCVPDSALSAYFNSDEVREAIHATRKIAAGTWSVCNDLINEYYDWSYETMLPFYNSLAQYHIMVFTGDVDMVVNSLGTQMAIDKLGRSIVSDWKSWKVPVDNGSSFIVGGFHRKYSTPDPKGSLQFITIRGAGHMVGLSRPQANLEFFSRQLKNPGNMLHH